MIIQSSMIPNEVPDGSVHSERRRSDRLLLTVPIRAEGADINGQTFHCDARAVSISRYGARVLIPQALNEGQTLRLKSSTEEYVADFRVAASLTKPGQRDYEYVVECVNEKENFWKIDFPASIEGETAGTKVLVECRRCETLALMPMTISELEALRAIGLVGKHCDYCNAISLWKYAHVGMSPYQARRMGQDSANNSPDSAAEVAPIERSHRRAYVLMPLTLRDAQGSEELIRTENISKGGFCFTSEKPHQLGDAVLAIFPGEEPGQKTEIPARIVRVQPIEGTNRKIFGAEYDHS